MVRLEASLRQAPELRQMPVHLDLEWREAQLGQLTRLLLGSDAGWRGDLTGELHLDGTADAAQVKTRLRATGVHRAEFAPAAPMDFDANCALSPTIPAAPSTTWSATLRSAMAASVWPGTCRALAASRACPAFLCRA